MELFDLLELVNDLPAKEQEEILQEEYERQKRYVDAICELKRREN